MRNNHCCHSVAVVKVQKVIECLLHQLLGLGVEGRGGLVWWRIRRVQSDFSKLVRYLSQGISNKVVSARGGAQCSGREKWEANKLDLYVITLTQE